ncbi:MAG: Gmad2 immunoglobulin-like domain-containing protein [Patescibacteria group bacterium]|jgi:hypothetical protein
MSKKLLVAFFIATAVAIYLLVFAPQGSNSSKEIVSTTANSPDIVVDTPKPNDVVTSPLVVKGKAKGTWYFEGQFPITLYYGVQNAFVTTNAFALGEWMTEDYVDFEVIINFPLPPENDGLLVLEKDNPSDLRELDANLSIPLRFHE